MSDDASMGGAVRPVPGRRRRIVADMAQLVREESLPAGPLPVVLRPTVDGVDLVAWAMTSRARIAQHLTQAGGVLFRGFPELGLARFGELVDGLCGGGVLEYRNRSTPRTQVGSGIYTSTEYPASHSIPLHNEMAYTRSWPMTIAFYSVTCATSGGETPIADSRRVYDRIDPAVRDRWAARKVMYVRNCGEGVDLPWEEVFQTNRRAEVEEYCARHGLELEWRGRNGLRTRQVCQAVAVHPVTGESVWFNQAHLFHVSSLPADVRQTLVGTMGEDLPRNAFYGDGMPLEEDVLEHIRDAYRSEAVTFSWQAGDVLVLDNMLVAHGRTPYTGPRKVLVSMSERHPGDRV